MDQYKGSYVGAYIARTNTVTSPAGETVSEENEIPEGAIKDLEFDVAVTVTEAKSRETSGAGQVGGEIFVLRGKVDLDTKAARQKTDTNTHRIKNIVPVLFRGQEVICLKQSKLHKGQIDAPLPLWPHSVSAFNRVVLK